MKKIMTNFPRKFLLGLAFFALAMNMHPSLSHADSKDIYTILKEKGLLTDDEIKKIKISEENKLKGLYKNGFKWDTGDKLGKIQIGGRVHGDVDIFENQHNMDSSIYVRRARIFASGKLYEFYEWKVQADFGEGKTSAKDLYINMNYDKRLQVKIGQFKEPFSLEQDTSSKYLDFKERSLIGSRIAPDRDIGIMLHGLCGEEIVGYQVGVFNGNGSNVSADSDNDKDVAMRLWYEPFKDLHIGGAFTWGHKSRGLTDYKASGSGTKVLGFDSSNVNADNMNLLRYGGEIVVGRGPFYVTSEYMRAEYDNVNLVASGSQNGFYTQGVYANASWFLTGEEKRPHHGSFGRIKPDSNFDPLKGGLGAWELVAGYEWVDIDNKWFSQADLSGTSRMDAYKVGVNWYHNPMFRIMLDYVYNDYRDAIVGLDSGAKDDNEHMVWMRFALEF